MLTNSEHVTQSENWYKKAYSDLGNRPSTLDSSSDIDFSKQQESRISVESSSITYGNQEIQKLLDARTLFQWILDFIATAIGFHKTDDLSSVRLKS